MMHALIALVAYMLGLCTGIIFYPLIKSGLAKMFQKNA